MVAKSTAKKSTTAKVAVNKAPQEFVGLPQQDGKFVEVTGKDVHKWANQVAGGNLNDIAVVALDNVNPKDTKPTPFGYSRPGGPRAAFHDYHILGIDGEFALGKILDKCKAWDKSHSRQEMVCTVALLNGGYSRSSKTWGTPFIKLVVKKQPR